MADHHFIGKACVYVGPYGGAGAMREVGQVSSADLSFSETEITMPDYKNVGGGLADSVSRVDEATMAMNWLNFTAENLAIALRGLATDEAASTVTDESHTAYSDGFIVLDFIDPSTVVVTDDPMTVTYTEGTDYTVSGTGITILASGTIADASAILIDYAYTAQRSVELLADSQQEYIVHISGLNEAKSGKPYSITAHRVKFSPAETASAISADDFAGLSMTAKLLKDSAIVTGGISQFAKWTQVEA